MQADGAEHTITLGPNLTISGTVSDATTGQPIPKFRVIAGWPTYGSNGTTCASWSSIDRFWQSFADGKFQYTYGELLSNDGFLFKFVADGYAPFVTRVVKTTEGSVRFDVKLTPAEPTDVTVFSPDGKFAAGIDIGLVSPGAGLRLIRGGFSRQTLRSAGALLLTDNQGQFALPPDPAVTKVIAAGPQGYAEATPTELATNREMNLQPWSQLEVTYITNGHPSAVLFDYEKSTRDSLFWDFQPTARIKTDSGWHYTFAQVPPGNHEVSSLVWYSNGAHLMVPRSQPPQPVTISAGETASITIDGTTAK